MFTSISRQKILKQHFTTLGAVALVSGLEVGLGLAQGLVKQLLNPFQAALLRKQLKVK